MIAVLGMGIPNFFLAVLLIQLFAVKLGWLPPAGPGRLRAPRAAGGRARDGVDGGEHAPDALVDARGALEGLRPHAEREGPAGKRILWVHALRNALVPVIALAGVTIPLVLGYTLIVEVIFRYEGLGFQFVQSILKRDYALAQTLALLFTAIVIMSNFLADVAHQLVDPRVRDRARAPRWRRASQSSISPASRTSPRRRKGASATRSRCSRRTSWRWSASS